VAVNAAKIKGSELPESNVPAKSNTNPNAQVNTQVSAQGLGRVQDHEQAQAPATVSGASRSSSQIQETITKTRLNSETFANGSGSVQHQDGSAGDDLLAITPVFKTPLRMDLKGMKLLLRFFR
jgi:hypothetical protein